MNIRNVPIGTRLAVGFGAGLLIMLAIAIVGLSSLTVLNRSTERLTRDEVPPALLAYQILGAVDRGEQAMRNTLILLDPTKTKIEVGTVAAANKLIKENTGKLTVLMTGSTDKALLNTLASTREKYLAGQAEFMKTVAEYKKEQAADFLLSDFRPPQQAFNAALNAIIKQQLDHVDVSGKDSADAYVNARNTMLVLALTALVLGVAIAVMTTRSIVRPLFEAVTIARRVANGDLTGTITVSSTDETGALMQSLKDMNDSLINTIARLHTGTETIALASREIASGNADLSTRTESQASSLEQTASSMEELTETVRQNADNARQANQLAISASDFAFKGGEVVSKVVNTMSSIKESSSKIADIIGVIDGIAFQTNILALNAAVEAARAGEQGRGFAVVASEVRSLAQRSAAAAREIKGLIGDSVAKVDAGSKLVDTAGQTMQDIVGSIRQVADIMSEISAASQEQSTGIREINQAIGQMDEMTQQNSALVEQAAAAAESLQDQAVALTQAIAIFQLPDGRERTSTVRLLSA
ncbi:methyl-accepting chemotaxis protein [Actimicrobium antarcticum]|uniref:Methyl-accepting chemotaxis protein n=1 Tax=Actimicrobium antarcticum TaxID=1051899 RepID=A0ABP7T434_9BURK